MGYMDYRRYISDPPIYLSLKFGVLGFWGFGVSGLGLGLRTWATVVWSWGLV